MPPEARRAAATASPPPPTTPASAPQPPALDWNGPRSTPSNSVALLGAPTGADPLGRTSMDVNGTDAGWDDGRDYNRLITFGVAGALVVSMVAAAAAFVVGGSNESLETASTVPTSTATSTSTSTSLVTRTTDGASLLRTNRNGLALPTPGDSAGDDLTRPDDADGTTDGTADSTADGSAADGSDTASADESDTGSEGNDEPGASTTSSSSSSTTEATTTTTEAPATTTTAAPTTTTTASGACSKWNLVLDEQFNGSSLNTSVWAPYNSAGNAGYGLRRPSAISVGGGLLTITARMENGSLVSGGMQHRVNQQYGRYEFRVRTDADTSESTSGVVLTWPASQQHPRDGENNVYETLAQPGDRSKFFTFIHKPFGSVHDQEYIEHNTSATAWHTMVMEWEPDVMRIYRDGSLIRTINETSADLLPDNPHFAAIQLDAWKHSVPSTVQMQVDYIKVFSLDRNCSG